jgi:serine/threonine protein kinase
MLRGLAQYRVLRSLGQGAQGQVLLAIDNRLNRRVCIKLYYLDGGLSARRHAVAEAWTLARVEGPRTATIYDVVANGGRLALVTRYVPGCDLVDLLRPDLQLPPANSVAIVSDLAAALAELRRARLAHGDIKPANVRIDLSGRAVLVDFGTATLVGQSSTGCSAESQSPEQSRGEPAGLQSDFFALGLLLHRMLTGAHPFYRDAALDRGLLRRGLLAAPELPDVPEPAATALRTLLLDLLAADPNRRPPSTFVLRERLRALRALLPEPDPLGANIMTLDERKMVPGPVPRLPPALIRLPLSQRALAWLRSYWRSGSGGARALLAGSAVVSLLLTTLLLFRPGPCIAVAPPSFFPVNDASAIFASAGTLHARLTRVLKRLAPHATVLGAGPASDSRLQLSKQGVWDVCVARRQLALEVSCAQGQCLLDVRGERGPETLRGQLWLPRDVDPRRLDAALHQLVREQRQLLLD